MRTEFSSSIFPRCRFIDDDFDPDHFDKDEINQQLKEWKAVWLNKWK